MKAGGEIMSGLVGWQAHEMGSRLVRLSESTQESNAQSS